MIETGTSKVAWTYSFPKTHIDHRFGQFALVVDLGHGLSSGSREGAGSKSLELLEEQTGSLTRHLSIKLEKRIGKNV